MLFLLPFWCIVACMKWANSEPYLPSRFFALRKSLVKVWLQKINPAITEVECSCPQCVHRGKEGNSCSPDVHPALADICDLTDTAYASISFRSPQPFNNVSPNFTKSMSFLQCFGGLKVGQEYQQRAAGTNTQSAHLIRYSRMQQETSERERERELSTKYLINSNSYRNEKQHPGNYSVQ